MRCSMLLSQHEDKSFKVLIDSAMDEFLKGLGIGEDILISLPTDLITTSCVNRRMDYCALSKKYEIINVEYQEERNMILVAIVKKIEANDKLI